MAVSEIDPIPQKASSTLHKFVISSWKNYCSAYNHLEVENEFITSSDVLYEAVLRRGNSKSLKIQIFSFSINTTKKKLKKFLLYIKPLIWQKIFKVKV